MCKHILNAQVSIRSPCCRKWFDCAQCHADSEDHVLQRTTEMTFVCKKCRKAFRKNMEDYDESDEYCPNCDNHYVLDALEPKAALKVESEDVRIDSRMVANRDERARGKEEIKLWDVGETADRLG